VTVPFTGRDTGQATCKMRIAIIHDWLTGMRGGEKVLSLLCRLMPQARLLTLLRVPGVCDGPIEGMNITTSFLNRLPGIRRYYRYLLPILPRTIERMDVSDFDLIVSSSHCVAKGVRRPPGALHVCYCHTPMRYVWDIAAPYEERMRLGGLALRAFSGRLRAWDVRTSQGVDCFLANSRAVAARIRAHYGRESQVVYPPINTRFFTPGDEPREDFYLMVTALTPYKRVDQAIAAFASLERPLRIIGSGPERRRLSRRLPANVRLMGWQGGEAVRDHYRRCRALLMPQEEDFGLTALEAMACGAPVIAYGAGGSLETVVPVDRESDVGPTGLLYTPQTPDGLAAAVRRFEHVEGCFDRRRLVAWAHCFTEDRFLDEFRQAVRPLLQQRGWTEPWSNAITG